jgi:hypothetical protein
VILQKLTRNSAHVCGVFLLRPSHLTGSEWEDFWRSPPHHREFVIFDYRRVVVFGVSIERTPSVTAQEWEDFWSFRSRRADLEDLNWRAYQASENRWPWSRRDNHR